MRVNAFIQARVKSTRLPAKVLQELNGRPVLAWVIEAAIEAREIDAVVVTTTTDSADRAVADIAADLQVEVVRGPELDVLDRFSQALDQHPADAIVRLTADCPLLDPRVIDTIVKTWRSSPAYDYISNTVVRTLPRGFDVELVRAEALRDLVLNVPKGHHRSHVTSWLYSNPERYACLGLVFAPDSSDLRVTLDEESDLLMLRELVAALPPPPAGWRAVVDVLRARPSLVALNAAVRTRDLEEG